MYLLQKQQKWTVMMVFTFEQIENTDTCVENSQINKNNYINLNKITKAFINFTTQVTNVKQLSVSKNCG